MHYLQCTWQENTLVWPQLSSVCPCICVSPRFQFHVHIDWETSDKIWYTHYHHHQSAIIPTVILIFSWYTLFSQTRKWRPNHSGITVSPGMEEMPSLNMPVQRLNVAILPLDLPCSGPVNHSGEILTTGKSHRKKPGRLLIHSYCISATEGDEKYVHVHFSSR